MSEWQSIFLPTVPVVDGIARGTITFLALLAFMRIVGQRESGGLGITDVLLVVLVTKPPLRACMETPSRSPTA